MKLINTILFIYLIIPTYFLFIDSNTKINQISKNLGTKKMVSFQFLSSRAFWKGDVIKLIGDTSNLHCIIHQFSPLDTLPKWILILIDRLVPGLSPRQPIIIGNIATIIKSWLWSFTLNHLKILIYLKLINIVTFQYKHIYLTSFQIPLIFYDH